MADSGKWVPSTRTGSSMPCFKGPNECRETFPLLPDIHSTNFSNGMLGPFSKTGLEHYQKRNVRKVETCRMGLNLNWF